MEENNEKAENQAAEERAEAVGARYQRWVDSFDLHAPALKEAFGLPEQEAHRFFLALTDPLYTLSGAVREEDPNRAEFLLDEYPRVVALFADEVKGETAFSREVFETWRRLQEAQLHFQQTYIEVVSVIMRAEGIDLESLRAGKNERPAEGYGDFGLQFMREAQKHWNKFAQTENYKEASAKVNEPVSLISELVFEWLRKALPDGDDLKNLLPKKEGSGGGGGGGGSAAGLSPLALQAQTLFIQTGQEVDALAQSAGYGPSRKYWSNDMQSGNYIWSKGGLYDTHHVRIPVSRGIGEAPADLAAIEQLIGQQNSDFIIAFYYVISVLAPPPTAVSPTAIIGGWIDLDDVMQKIGWTAKKPTPAERESLRRQIWKYLVFGEEAVVVGKRSIPYFDKVTKKEISTYIESAAWRITDKVFPEQGELFSDPSEPNEKPAPLRARIVVSEQWEPLFRNPHIVQYIPLGELIGSIPPNKISGDWARLIGCNLLREWRKCAKAADRNDVQLTRRELLTHYTPKTKAVEEFLQSDKPRKAVEYYIKALSILLEKKLIAATGDAARGMSVAKMLKDYTGYKWGEDWLNGYSGLTPGDLPKPIIHEIAEGIFEVKARDLQAPAKKKMGRPRKS